MGFELVFHNLTSKRTTALRKRIQSVVNYSFKLLFLGTCSLKQIVTMIVRVRLL